MQQPLFKYIGFAGLKTLQNLNNTNGRTGTGAEKDFKNYTVAQAVGSSILSIYQGNFTYSIAFYSKIKGSNTNALIPRL